MGFVIVAASALGLSSSAAAATPDVTYVSASHITRTNVAGQAGWTKFLSGGFSSSISGLAMASSHFLSYGVATPIPASTGTAVVDFARATTFSSSSNDVGAAITLFDENNGDKAIFSFDGAAALSDPTSEWYPTNPIGELSAPFTLAQLDSELSTNPAMSGWTIRSFSLEAYVALTNYTMTVNGEHFSFLPEPVVTAAPTTVTTTDLAADGVTVTTTGFLPGELVDYTLSNGESGIAGTVTSAGGISFIYRSSVPAGPYTLTLVGSTSAVAQSFDFTVQLDQFTNVPTPTISGTGILGTALTAALDTSGITPAPADVQFDWYRADTDALVHTDSASFTPTSTLLGAELYVIATLTAPNTAQITSSQSASSPTVRLNAFANVPTPTVTGSGALGTAFTAALGTNGVTPTPETVVFTWYRADTDVVVQSGGTTLMPNFTLVGTEVYVTATLEAANTASLVTGNSTVSSTVHLATFTPGAAPLLEGQAALGGELTAVIDTEDWAPVPNSFTYEWFLEDGTPISNQTAQKLTITNELVGESVYVVATAHSANYLDFDTASTSSDLIVAPTFAIDGATTVAPGATVKLKGSGLLFGEQVTVELRSTPVLLGTFTAASNGDLAATVTVPAGTAPGIHNLVVLRNGVEIGRVELKVSAVPALAGTGQDGTGFGMLALAALLALGLGAGLLARRRVVG